MENVYKKGKMKKLWTYFSTYEKWWLLIFSVIAIIASIVMPEESINGIDGTLITIFCVVSTLASLFCEILAAKQSKWNNFIYIFVEIIEIIKFLMIAMYANLFVSLLFWLPIHIVTFINWQKHEDKQKKEMTVVRSLKPKESILLIVGIIAWTVAIGYILARFMPDTGFFSSDSHQVAAAYLDACASALAIANGVLFFFRFRESWYPWILYSVVNIAYMILSGFWIFIVLQLGYLTNAIYAYTKWSKYIKSTEEIVPAKPEETN